MLSNPFPWVGYGLLAVLVGCGGPLVGVTVVDERTALENQVLGTYQELNQERIAFIETQKVFFGYGTRFTRGSRQYLAQRYGLVARSRTKDGGLPGCHGKRR